MHVIHVCYKNNICVFTSPQDMFDPHGWSEDSYYEALGAFSSKLCLTFKLVWIELTTSVNYLCAVLSTAKAQKVEMDKLEKAKKEKTKVRTLRHSTY